MGAHKHVVGRIDPKADALYFTVKRGQIHHTREWCRGVIVDLNARGEVLGVEMLDIPKNIRTAMRDRLAGHVVVPRWHTSVRRRAKRGAH